MNAKVSDQVQDESKEKPKYKSVQVHVVHVNETERTAFKTLESSTLQSVWDQGYVELGIARKPTDIFQTDGEEPKSLMGHLNLTLEQAKDQKVIRNFHFAIAHETGGAVDVCR